MNCKSGKRDVDRVDLRLIYSTGDPKIEGFTGSEFGLSGLGLGGFLIFWRFIGLLAGRVGKNQSP
jgi:hypothetical protein